MLITGVNLQNKQLIEIDQQIIQQIPKSIPRSLNLIKKKKNKLQKIKNDDIYEINPQSQKNLNSLKYVNIFQEQNILPLITNKQLQKDNGSYSENRDLYNQKLKKSGTYNLCQQQTTEKIIKSNLQIENPQKQIEEADKNIKCNLQIENNLKLIDDIKEEKTIQVKKIEIIKKKVTSERTVKTTNPTQQIEKKEQIMNIQIEDFDLTKLTYFYRYHIMTLFQQQNNIDAQIKDQKKEILNRIIKIINTKTKYRYRCKMIVINYAPLKQFYNIDPKVRYEKLQAEKLRLKEQASSSESDENEDQEIQEKKKKVQETISFAMLDEEYWKKKNGLSKKTKIFICKGGYSGIRQALEDRGWYENDNYLSPVFDLKWTCKSMDCYNVELKNKQYVNHFRNTDVYTTKSGISRNLRNLIQHGVDIDTFFPKCFDLFDQLDFIDFLEEFKFSQAICVLIKFVTKNFDQQLDLLNEVKLKTAISVVKRRLQKIEQLIEVSESNYLMNKQEWDILQLNQNKLQDYDITQINNNLIQTLNIDNDLWAKAKIVLNQLKENDPQFSLYGEQNIWIVKPALLSRGRGIKVYNSLNKIIDHLLYRESQYVCQKYIERPLLIKQRKFDIRQWTIVSSWNPLKVWFYDLSYLRFCGTVYDSSNLENRFVHLTNNSVQVNDKNFHKSDIPGNMWSSEQFQEYLKQNNNGQDIFKEKIQPSMEKLIIHTLKACNDQVEEISNSFEMFGYDFMVDEQYNTWIIEINKSPSMDTKTDTTKRLVSLVLEDAIKVMVDYEMSKKRNKKDIDTGYFRCIYKSK